MLNKTLKVVGIAAGIAVIAVGAVALAKHVKSQLDMLNCCDCDNCEDCECHGKYAEECDKVGECLVEEIDEVEDFSASEEAVEETEA